MSSYCLNLRVAPYEAVWICTVKTQETLQRLSGYSFRDYLDLFKFRFFKPKESRHLDNLIRTYEILGPGAEIANAGSKRTALHRFRDVQTNTARTLLEVQTEIANNHFAAFAVTNVRE